MLFLRRNAPTNERNKNEWKSFEISVSYKCVKKKNKKKDADVVTGGSEYCYRGRRGKRTVQWRRRDASENISSVCVCAGSLYYDDGGEWQDQKALYAACITRAIVYTSLTAPAADLSHRPCGVWAAGIASDGCGGPHRSACARHASRHPPPQGVRGMSGRRPGKRRGKLYGACACPRVVTVRVCMCVRRASCIIICIDVPER